LVAGQSQNRLRHLSAQASVVVSVAAAEVGSVVEVVDSVVEIEAVDSEGDEAASEAATEEDLVAGTEEDLVAGTEADLVVETEGDSVAVGSVEEGTTLVVEVVALVEEAGVVVELGISPEDSATTDPPHRMATAAAHRTVLDQGMDLQTVPMGVGQEDMVRLEDSAEGSDSEVISSAKVAQACTMTGIRSVPVTRFKCCLWGMVRDGYVSTPKVMIYPRTRTTCNW